MTGLTSRDKIHFKAIREMSILEWFLIAFLILQSKSSINHRNANTFYVISFAVELVTVTKLNPPEPSQ